MIFIAANKLINHHTIPSSDKSIIYIILDITHKCRSVNEIPIVLFFIATNTRPSNTVQLPSSGEYYTVYSPLHSHVYIKLMRFQLIYSSWLVKWLAVRHTSFQSIKQTETYKMKALTVIHILFNKLTFSELMRFQYDSSLLPISL
jgi:hypothetical protein